MNTDAERLRIALVNMLVNARHAVNGARRAGGVAPLDRRAARAGGDACASSSPTRGVGIEPADLAHIFDPYFTTKRGGTGLGLPIAKNIVEGLGGTIAVASAPGAGTDDSTSICRSTPAAHDAMTHRGSILLVDDEEKILKALGRALRDDGHDVVETDERAAGAAAARRAELRRAARRQRDAGEERPRSDPRVRRHRRPKASGRRS